MPRSVIITTGSLVILAALAGYWLGQRQVNVDSADVIAAVARLHGGDPATCVGWPGQGAWVMYVECSGVTYRVNRFGQVSRAPEDGI
ncbi:hypothetical protein [uncultured Tateyamaria sp.]|uniref:hypothetical protein n=1 Tax=uncultured Tateyamaria sp. TaxID=455651 RepID=UPI00261D5944|nr:hypothetical protein [uncultured Tateyamaria sp.]